MEDTFGKRSWISKEKKKNKKADSESQGDMGVFMTHQIVDLYKALKLRKRRI